MVTVAELTTRVRALPQTSHTLARTPSEDIVRKRIASLGIQMDEVCRGRGRGRGRRVAITRKDADTVAESFRRQDAARSFDEEFLGFCIEPEVGSSEERIGVGLPWSHRFAPPGVHVDDPGPAHISQSQWRRS